MEDCSCARGRRTARCVHCYQSDLVCPQCLTEHHRRHLFTHVAEVWDDMDQFFKRHQVTTIPGAEFTVSLGHAGEQCPCQSDKAYKINLVDLNGIHEMKIRYCGCSGLLWRETKALQLVQAGFFPPTWERPRTAFAIRLIQRYHNHPQSVYELAEGLRRDSNNAFPMDISVSLIVIISPESF
jgi:hypothetical protein